MNVPDDPDDDKPGTAAPAAAIKRTVRGPDGEEYETVPITSAEELEECWRRLGFGPDAPCSPTSGNPGDSSDDDNDDDDGESPVCPPPVLPGKDEAGDAGNVPKPGPATVAEVIQLLEDLGLTVVVHGDRLWVQPASNIPNDVRAILKSRRAEIMAVPTAAPAVMINFQTAAHRDRFGNLDSSVQFESIDNAICRGCITSQEFTVVLSAGQIVAEKRLELGTIKPVKVMGKLPAHPLTPKDWFALQLAIDGAADNTAGPENVTGADYEFLLEGFVRRRAVNLLVGAPKVGKSTLLRPLLWAAASDVQPVYLLGRQVHPFRPLIITEESSTEWKDRPPNVRLEFFNEPPITRLSAWRNRVEQWGKVARAYGLDTLMFDSVTRICGLDENSSRKMTAAMAALQDLARAQGLTVVATHHAAIARTGSAAARGSGAIRAQADVILTLTLGGDDEFDPRRRLSAVGRGVQAQVDYVRTPDGNLVVPGPAKAAGRRSVL